MGRSPIAVPLKNDIILIQLLIELQHLLDGFFDAGEFEFGSGTERGVLLFARVCDDAEISLQFGLGARGTQGNPGTIREVECEHVLFGEVYDGLDAAVGKCRCLGVEEIADAGDIDTISPETACSRAHCTASAMSFTRKMAGLPSLYFAEPRIAVSILSAVAPMRMAVLTFLHIISPSSV